MSVDEVELALAESRSKAARHKLAGTMVELQARLNPKALARDAVEELRETGQELARDGLDAIKRHPLTLAGVVTGIGLFLARKPIRSLIERKSDETVPAPASLSRTGPRSRAKGKSE